MKIGEVDKAICNATRASEVLDIPYTTLLYWIDTGLTHKTIERERIQGRPVWLSFKDLVELNTIKDLRDQGAPTQAIRSAIEWLNQKSDLEWLANRLLFVVGEDIVACEERPDGSFGQLISLLKNKGQLYLIDLEGAEEEIKNKLNKLTGGPD